MLDDLMSGKDSPLTSEAQSQGQKVVAEAKEKPSNYWMTWTNSLSKFVEKNS